MGDAARYAALALVKAEHDQDQGRHREAIQGLRAALMASEESPDQRRALIVIQLGKLLLRQERFAEAKKLFTDLLSLVDRHGPTVVGANCHFHLGEIALAERDLDLAAEHHGNALEIRRQQGLDRPISASLSAHGALALERGDYPEALRFFREAQEALGDGAESELADAHVGIGRALGNLGDPTAGTRHLRRALELTEGRGNAKAEQIARLHLAANLLDLGQLGAALEQARLAHLRLSLLPESTHLGDAEQLVGRVLCHMQELDEAEERFRDAMRIHLRHQRRAAAALDSSWLLRIALERGDQAAILKQASELDALFEEVRFPIHGELVLYRLFRAFIWLRERGTASRDPLDYLRRAHRELMRKLGFLAPKMRHQFLFHVRDHQELLNVAVEHDLSLPSFTVRPMADSADE